MRTGPLGIKKKDCINVPNQCIRKQKKFCPLFASTYRDIFDMWSKYRAPAC